MKIVKFSRFSSWFDIIEPPAVPMLTLRLNIRGENLWIHKIDEIMALKERFLALNVCLHDQHERNIIGNFVQVTSNFGTHIRQLIIHKAKFFHAKQFCDILRNVRLLEELEIHRTSFDLSDDEDAHSVRPVKLKHLKTIKVVYSSFTLFKYLVGSQISTLILSTALVRPEERDAILKFLEASERLETIEMDREGFERIFQLEFPKFFPFKLKKFKFFSYTFRSEVNQVEQNFINFLESMASSLEELIFEYSSREILQTIFTKLVNLRILKLNSNSLPTDKEFYDQMISFEFMKEFDADDRIPNAIAAKGILRNLPNLETLRVECDPNDVISEILPFIANNNPEVKTLQIDTLKVKHIPDVKFFFLEELHVFLFKDEQLLLTFIRSNPTLLKLKVKWVYEATFVDEILDVLLTQTSLKHLSFGGKLETVKAIYNKIRDDHRELETLELNFKTDNGLQTSLIHFPEDPSKWASNVCLTHF